MSQSPITVEQWRAIERLALASNDIGAAKAARQADDRASGRQVQTAWGTLAKKAVEAALKYGRQYLPAKIRPYADKLYNLIDQIENTAELGIATFLTSQGIPPDVSLAAAKWIVTFT